MSCYQPLHLTRAEAFDRCQLRAASSLSTSLGPSKDGLGHLYPKALRPLLRTLLPAPTPGRTHLPLLRLVRCRLQQATVCSVVVLRALSLPQQTAPRVGRSSRRLDALPAAPQTGLILLRPAEFSPEP